MNDQLTITFLGTGTSQGVPVIACNCEVCLSSNTKDKRLRTSILITHNNLNYVVDTGPDFRQQMLREEVLSLEAVLFTHEHKDHVAGLDDIRAFNFKQKRDMPLYGNSNVEMALKREFHYAFSDNKYPGIPRLDFNLIDKEPFKIGNLEVIPVEVLHGELPVLGFRVYDLVYITDASYISDKEKDKVRGCKILIVNALRIKKHNTHFNLEQALEFIEEIKPEQAYLTHISHLFGKNDDIQANLPDNVVIAYDGLKIKM